MAALKIVYKDPRKLKPRTNNPRTHTRRQIKQIAACVRELGFINPVLTDARNRIIAGHARVEAATLLNMCEIPTVCVGHLSPVEIRAYVIADNRLAENAGWDRAFLALEFQELSVALDFDVTVTGFEAAEVDLLIGELNDSKLDDADDVPLIDRSVPAISRPGDLWRIGEHFLLCDNALKRDSYITLLGKRKARMVFTDPPYNVPIAGNVSGLGKAKHRDFAMASGEMSTDEYTEFLETAFTRLADFSTDGSIHFVCMDWRHMREVLQAASSAYTELKNLCVWSKTNAGMGSFYRSQHELIFPFKNGIAPHINNIELGRFGRHRTNIWSYSGVNSFGKQRDTDLAMHPTTKPVALVADAILDCSRRGDVVLDVFAGSGTTLIAAEKTGRCGCGIEIDPHYVDVTIRRFDEMHNLKAVHVENGNDFDQLKDERSRRTP